MTVSDDIDLDNPVVMFKVLKDEHLSSFVNEGRLHMRTLGYFNNFEDINKASRGDKFEGIDHVYQGNKGQLSFNGTPVITQKICLRTWDESNLDMNVFCMGAISVRDLIEAKGKIDFSEKYLEFGNKVVLFSEKGLVELLSRVENNLKENNDITSHRHYRKFANKVEYIDSNQSGSLGIFKKFEEYSWQYEWRLAIHHNSKQEIFSDICLGDLSSLCSIIDTSEFVKNSIVIRNFSDIYS